MIRSKLSTIFLTVTAVLFIGCDQFKPRATGNDDEILVFADSTDWTTLEEHISEVFEFQILTPQPEKVFTILYYPIEEFKDYKIYKNLIIVAPLSSEGPTAQFVASSLSPEVRTLVESGEEFVINKYDLYRRDQILMFLTARDMDALIDQIRTNREQLQYYFQKVSLERELDDIYADAEYEQIELERRFLDSYRWRIFIPPDYWVAIDSSSERFVWLRRANPVDMERWIFVHWIEEADPNLLAQSWAFELRNHLTERFLRTLDEKAHVQIADDVESMSALSIRETDFLGRYALEMRGLWRFSDMSGGGPFVNYTFYDEPSHRIYMIDGSIFAPRYEKKKLILQINALAHTFQTIDDLTEEQKEEYLESD